MFSNSFPVFINFFTLIISSTTFKVWAPTADSVSVNLYADGTAMEDDADYVDETNRYIRMKSGDVLEIGRVLKKHFIQELNYGC